VEYWVKTAVGFEFTYSQLPIAVEFCSKLNSSSVNGVDVVKLLNWSSLIADLPAGAVLLDAAPNDNEWQGNGAE